MTIEEFIAAEAAKPFAWARNDCTMMCDRWVQLMRGVSPVEAGPIVYSNRDSALAILPRLPQIMNRAMRIAGLEKTSQPQIGAVGLVIFGNRIGPALHAGQHWLTRHEDGFMAAPLTNVWKAWEVMPR
jgi:hypothetical protein